MSRPCKLCEESIGDRGPDALYCLACLPAVKRRNNRRHDFKRRQTEKHRTAQAQKVALLRSDPEFKAQELAREKAPKRLKAKAEYQRRRRAWIRVRRYLAERRMA